MRKKLTSLALALVMCLGLTVPAFAETRTETIDGITVTAYSDGTIKYTGAGEFTVVHAEYGIILMDEATGGRGQVNTVTVNIGPGITVDQDVLDSMKEILNDFGAKSVKINTNSASAGQGVGGFTDVKPGDYFADPVVWAVNKKITAGTTATTFSPGKNCTVAEIITFLYQAYGAPKYSASIPFTDVKSSDWYYNAARWAYVKGIISGSTFGGSQPCTRSMAVNYMWKAAGAAYPDFKFAAGWLEEYTGSSSDVVIPNVIAEIDSYWLWTPKNMTSVTIPTSVKIIDEWAFDGCENLTDVYYEGSKAQWDAIEIGEPYTNAALTNATIHYNSKMPQPSVNTGFTDVPATADYAQAVAWAVEQGITSGTSAATFSPDMVCTRGQIVTFLYAALGK